MPMHLDMERGAVLAVCPNPAWQKTLAFDNLREDKVNRAVSKQEFGGGKGVNVVRVLRRLGYPAMLGTFIGGHNGELLAKEINGSGAGLVSVEVPGETRICTTLLNAAAHTATEIIEPSAEIPANLVAALQKQLQETIHAAGAVCLCGSCPPGVTADFYAALAATARECGCPLLLDDVKTSRQVLATGGVTMLKINADELRLLMSAPAEAAVPSLAVELQKACGLPWLGVTDGAGQAWLFGVGRAWRFDIPLVSPVISAIGCGDCAAAILTRRLLERPTPELMPGYFAEALGCASASCRTAIPSVFEPEQVVLPTFEELPLQ